MECFCIINVEQNKPKKRELDSMLNNTLNISSKCSCFFCTTWARWHRILRSSHVIVVIDFVFLYFKCYISTVGSLLPPPRPGFAPPPLLHHPACDNTSGFAGSYCTQAAPAGRLPDRDLLFAHVQTSAGLLFCFMTISAALPWHPGPWPQSLILSSVLNFQTSAVSFQCQSRTPKCCHSRFPGRRARWVRGTSGNLQEWWESGRELDTHTPQPERINIRRCKSAHIIKHCYHYIRLLCTYICYAQQQGSMQKSIIV